jgi:hypothetical protein
MAKSPADKPSPKRKRAAADSLTGELFDEAESASAGPRAPSSARRDTGGDGGDRRGGGNGEAGGEDFLPLAQFAERS